MTDLSQDYTTAGFSHRLGWGTKPAVVVVDAVRAYSDPASSLYCETGPAAEEAMYELLSAAREGGHPIAYTAVAFRPDMAEALHFVTKVPALRQLIAGSPFGGWSEPIAPSADDLVITKQYPSAFFGTTLASWLTVRQVDTVVVCGFSTSGCVRATALDALQNGFRPMVVRQACADRDERPHESNLFDLDAKYADVIDLAEAVAHLKASS